MLATAAFLAFWILLGVVLFFVASRGGPRGARAALQSQSRSSRRSAIVLFTIFYVAIGVAVPLAIELGNRDSANADVAGVNVHLTKQEQHGREIFGTRCASCHTLAAAKAVGKVGPDLDKLIGAIPAQGRRAYVLSAVTQGRQRGSGTMPALIVQGSDAQAVSAFVAQVAGK